MPKAASVDPDKLVRQSAGTYRTADERFEVRGAGSSGWFLVDTQQTNEFGQELITGPYATLDAVRSEIPAARSANVTPMRRSPPAGAQPGGRKQRVTRQKPPPPPPTWIDRLPTAEATEVRRLIVALERDGVEDAEALVRRDREGGEAAVALRLIERRLEAIVREMPERAQPGARQLVARIAEVLTGDGAEAAGGIPGWVLVEVGPEPEPANRRIIIRELPD